MNVQPRSPVVLPSRKYPGTYGIGGWVGPKIGLNILKSRKFLALLGFEQRNVLTPS
jgi:hypothetical protein